MYFFVPLRILSQTCILLQHRRLSTDKIGERDVTPLTMGLKVAIGN